MNRLCLAIIGVLLVAFTFDGRAQASMATLLTNGPTATRLNIVFLSEGYTTNDLSHFHTDARTMLNRMLTAAPLGEYSNYFNAFAISVPSNQSGSDHYTPTTNLVDTYFNSRFDSSGIQRLVTIDSVGRSRANALLAQFIPEYDIVAVVVNDTQYGGSGGSILVSSINSQSPEIATHEMGHTFAQLGDEYSYAGSTPGERVNATAQTNRASIKWNIWISSGTPVPTPDTSGYYNVVGLFNGAVYSTNYYRPKHDCKMRSLGVAFCEVCGEALVKTIYTKLSVVESFFPSTNSVIRLTNGMTAIFSLTNLVPRTHSLNIQWFTNNVAVAGRTSAVYVLSGFDLPAGVTNLVRANVYDPTAYVRNDPTNVMTKSIVWRTSSAVLPPILSVNRQPTQLILSWPGTAAGFDLEQAGSVSALPSWTPLVRISNQVQISIPFTNQQRLFRLKKP